VRAGKIQRGQSGLTTYPLCKVNDLRQSHAALVARRVASGGIIRVAALQRQKRLSQAELFAAVFFELSEALGDSVSSARLLEAADHLVRLIDDDFGINAEVRPLDRASYYSRDTYVSIVDRQWQILCKECAQDYLEGEMVDPTYLKRRLQELGVFDA
jgi:hypothetical protein